MKNWHVIFFGNPSGGNFFTPVSHCIMFSTFRFGISTPIDKKHFEALIHSKIVMAMHICAGF